MSDLNSILSDEPTEELEPVETEDTSEVEQELPETEEQEAEEGEQPETSTADPEPEKPDPVMVPLAALHETRDENKALKRAIEDLQRRMEPKQEEVKAPDILDDQEGYNGFIQQRISMATMNARLDMSEGLARDSYGDDAVNAALEAAKAAGVATSFADQKHPWGAMVKWHEKQLKMAEIGDDPDGWREREREKLKAELQAELVAQNVTAQGQAKAPSLANQPNLGSRNAPVSGVDMSLDDILKG